MTWWRLTVFAVVVLTACSGADTTTTTVSSATTTTAAAATTTTSPQEGVLMELSSPAFDHEAPIPLRFTCDGDDVSPPLTIASLPDEAVSLVLIVDDPDAPAGTWDHWVAFDIAPMTSIPADVGPLGTAGSNSWNRLGYGGPCPPSGTHRYFFTALALDGPLGLGEGATKAEVLTAAEGHILAEAVLMGTYTR